MTGTPRRAGAVLGVMMALGSMVSGCADGSGTSETAAERTARLEPLVRAVPGVTGGEFTVKNASLSNLYSCNLTSDAPDKETLKEVLTGVLRTLRDATADDHEESMVSCAVTNASEGVATDDLGLNNPSWLGEVREKLR